MVSRGTDRMGREYRCAWLCRASQQLGLRELPTRSGELSMPVRIVLALVRLQECSVASLGICRYRPSADKAAAGTSKGLRTDWVPCSVHRNESMLCTLDSSAYTECWYIRNLWFSEEFTKPLPADAWISWNPFLRRSGYHRISWNPEFRGYGLHEIWASGSMNFMRSMRLDAWIS